MAAGPLTTSWTGSGTALRSWAPGPAACAGDEQRRVSPVRGQPREHVEPSRRRHRKVVAITVQRAGQVRSGLRDAAVTPPLGSSCGRSEKHCCGKPGGHTFGLSSSTRASQRGLPSPVPGGCTHVQMMVTSLRSLWKSGFAAGHVFFGDVAWTPGRRSSMPPSPTLSHCTSEAGSPCCTPAEVVWRVGRGQGWE